MATTTPEHDQRIAVMTFSSVYPHYVAKVEKKGRTEAELLEVIRWLTGFTDTQIQKHIDDKITGTICGYRIQDIETPLTRQVRYLDKLVDELAKGKAMEKILREG